MSYFRLYPSRNNTIFRYKTSSTATSSENINTGANPIMELMQGRGESKLLYGFDLPAWLRTRLSEFTFTANLQLWDAGTLFAPGTKLGEVKLKSFEDDFSEGDGYSFDKPENLIQVSNWKYRDSTNLWSTVSFTDILTYELNTINEDLNFSITGSISDFITNGIEPKYCLEYSTPTLDTLLYAKYIHSNYTKTVFKPYIEFFINDNINDKTFSCLGGQLNKIYLVNQGGNDVSGVLTATTQHEGFGASSTIVTRERVGVYSISITPPVVSLKDSYSTILWAIDGVDVKKQIVTVKSPNQFEETIEQKNLFFYPTTPYTHNIVRHGDVIPFSVISQIRGKGTIVTTHSYEYKITSADGFEMTPWTEVSVYRDKMYFNVNTEYFFPEQQYEVWVRMKTNDFTITSNQTHKFKLAMNDKSHMRQLSTSPYYSREIFFGK